MTLYDPTKPTDLPPPQTGVPSVKANFSQYATGFGNNHVPLNATYEGKHANVILQQQGSIPSNEGGFDSLYSYVANAAFGPTLEIFARIPQFLTLDKPNNQTQLTYHAVNVAGPQYQSFLAGGYIIYFGTATQNTLNIPLNSLITLSPAPSKILCIIANPTRLALVNAVGTFLAPQKVNVVLSTINAAQFTIFAVAPGPGLAVGDVTWTAIAKQ
jgi:hypothetical protein